MGNNFLSIIIAVHINLKTQDLHTKKYMLMTVLGIR